MNIEAKKLIYDSLGGTLAMSAQITCFYWLKTLTTYQYKTGLNTYPAFKQLVNQNGILRFYNGYFPSLVMGSGCRFGDVASYKYFNSKENLNSYEKSIYSSICSTIWRINLMPIDTLDNMLQVYGKNGTSVLREKIKKKGVLSLYNGGLAWSSTNLIGYIGWFNTYTFLEFIGNKYDINNNYYNMFEGVTATIVSDTITNPIRVLKIYRQTNKHNISYYNSYKEIINEYGYRNFIFRGLKTRLFMHSLQNGLFVIMWKKFDKYLESLY